MTNYFLGIDCSTQSMKGLVIDELSLTVQTKILINYDKDLSHFHTQNGVYLGKEKQVYSNPLMWVEALDLLFEKLQRNDIPINNIEALSGSAQQHGTVYLNKQFLNRLKTLNSNQPLSKQLEDVFSRELSPVWMDSSTTRQCQEIREALGGVESTINLTGSNTFERFSGPQIRKFYQTNPRKYETTAWIHLISSFLSTLLLGNPSPIDHGDGSGMNLMNIRSKKWDNQALNATAPNLGQKLPPLAESFQIIGNIAPYYVDRYGFSPDTKLLPWTGDNPSSLIGVGLVKPDQVAISLGTSDTYFNYMRQLSLDLNGESHVFGTPTGDYMALICFKNGSLAREAIKNSFNLSWEEFSNILKRTPPGNYGRIMLPYFYPEIVPLILEPKVYRFGFKENNMEANVRGIVEAQCLSMRIHSQWLKTAPLEIIATGGGSENREILQVIANVFQSPVKALKNLDSAALGAALRCAKSYQDHIGKKITWEELTQKCTALKPYETILPLNETTSLYEDMEQIYQRYEQFVLNNGKNPERKRQKFTQKYF
ncbi:MAG: carbohydrate kinase [Promethearchaeota archaeon]|nr:MAG: carbohydrate kinase [Candidatus Lokiarchaeota archaeon]